MINDQKLQELIKWHPHPNQQKILDCESRDIAICAGRRFGKSAICAYIALKTLLEPDKRIWIVAPTYDLTQKVWSYIQQWYLLLKPKAKFQNRPYPKLKTSWGSWIEGRSAETPSGLLGEEVDLLIIDEAPLVPRKIYEDYLFPVTSSRKARTILIGSPFGQDWFWEKHMKLKESGGAFNFKSTDGVSITQEELEEIRKKLPELSFRQSYLAEFLPDGASVFRFGTDIISDTLRDVEIGHYYSMGVDLAKMSDFSVITVVDRLTNEVVYLDRFKDIDYPFQKQRIKATALRYNNARVTIDSTGVGTPIKDDLEREGLFIDDFTFTNRSKKELIEKLSIFIEQKFIKIPQNQILIDELRAFGMRLTDSRNVVYGAPEGLHDDCVYSLALAVWGLQGKSFTQKTALQRELEKVHKTKKSYI